MLPQPGTFRWGVPCCGFVHTRAKGNGTSIPVAPESILEDGLVMIGLLAVEDPTMVALAGGREWREGHLQLDHMEAAVVQQLRTAVRDITDVKLVITGLDGTSILGQLAQLDDYKFQIEVCLPVFTRTSNQWTGETTTGSLPN